MRHCVKLSRVGNYYFVDFICYNIMKNLQFYLRNTNKFDTLIDLLIEI